MVKKVVKVTMVNFDHGWLNVVRFDHGQLTMVGLDHGHPTINSQLPNLMLMIPNLKKN